MLNGGIGYNTFKEFKDAQGPAGPGNQWHHIVEQSQIDKSGFDPTLIHNTNNMISIPSNIHAQISGHYGSIPIDGSTNGLIVRNWLAGQRYYAQYQYGIYVLTMFGVI